LIDDLDKEINTYSMRAREWYGWHFPEINKIVPDNELYARVIRLMGNKSKAVDTDFSEILDKDTAQDIIDAAKISMGTDVKTFLFFLYS
jgi:nucleolar protein 58